METSPPATVPWLIRIPDIFAGLVPEVLKRIGASSHKRLGQEYHLIKAANPAAMREPGVAMFLRWTMPVHHAWPCQPQKMEGFIEKGAQTLLRKFAGRNPQALLVGVLEPSAPHPAFRSLASNLRGRALQLFPPMRADGAEEQDPAVDSLFCLVGREGLYAGLCPPRDANGLHPGGSRYISQDSEDTISRAGAKIAEALHYLLMHRAPLPAGSHWVELGASPGGMTSELLARGQRVTAVDRAPLDKRLHGKAGLSFVRADAAEFQPREGTVFDAILCDMNSEGREAMRQVARLVPCLRPGGLVVFTLKSPRFETMAEPVSLFHAVAAAAESAGLRLLAQTHLTYNRNEFTLFFEKNRG